MFLNVKNIDRAVSRPSVVATSSMAFNVSGWVSGCDVSLRLTQQHESFAHWSVITFYRHKVGGAGFI